MPLLPWGGFVIAGLAWQRTTPRWRPGLLLLIGVALLAAMSPGSFDKDPLNLRYLLLFTFLCLVISEGVQRMEIVYRAPPGLARVCEYLSQHLLPATVLHYFPVVVVAQLFRHRWPIFAPAFKSQETLMVVAAWVLTFVALLAILPAGLALWERVRMSPTAVRARRRIHVLAPLLILGVLVPMDNLGRVSTWSYYPLGLPPSVELALRTGCYLLVLAAMFYFALELDELRRRGRNVAGSSTPAGPPTIGGPPFTTL